MRRFLPLVALFAVLAFAANGSAATLFVVAGKGWGHGVGLSQYGAYGMARGFGVDGPKTWQQIIAHYFHNTEIGNRSGDVSVLLANNRSSVTIGDQFRVEAGARVVSHVGDSVVTKTSTGRIKVSGITKSFASPATFFPTGGPLHLGAKHYRGKLVVAAVGGGVRVVNRLGIDAYVRGVVTNESPAGWGDVGAQEALNAQAVAARSYALFTVNNGGGKCSGFLCPTTADQVYNGYDSETANGNEAVDATSGKVVLYNGAVAQTFFSSSTGGRTATNVDTWGSLTAVPYLESTPDPADLNPANPNRAWRVLFKPRELGNKLGTAGPRDVVVSARGSGRVRQLFLTGNDWSQTVNGTADHFRSALGLKSARFWVGMQSIFSDKRESRCRRAVRLDVFAHDVGAVSAEQRPASSSTWTPITLTNVEAGHWRATRHPCQSIDYRVRSAKAAGPSIHVTVSPDVAFSEIQSADALAGRVNPTLAGSPVAVQRDTTSGWVAVAHTTVAADGTFRADFAVHEGVYRARVVPPASTGLVTGYSPVLHVVTG
jgi:stage II sporulation protein D